MPFFVSWGDRTKRMREGLAHESKCLSLGESKRERWWRVTREEMLRLVAMASSWSALVPAVWADASVRVADKWPNAACGERRALTIVSRRFPFISSDLSVALVLHHNKRQYSNALDCETPPNTPHSHDRETHSRLTPHILFLFGKMGVGDELKSNNLETLEGGKKHIDPR